MFMRMRLEILWVEGCTVGLGAPGLLLKRPFGGRRAMLSPQIIGVVLGGTLLDLRGTTQDPVNQHVNPRVHVVLPACWGP